MTRLSKKKGGGARHGLVIYACNPNSGEGPTQKWQDFWSLLICQSSWKMLSFILSERPCPRRPNESNRGSHVIPSSVLTVSVPVHTGITQHTYSDTNNFPALTVAISSGDCKWGSAPLCLGSGWWWGRGELPLPSVSDFAVP